MPKSPAKPIRKQITATRRSLKTLDRSLNRLPILVAVDAKDRTRRRPRLSAKGRASLVLQGRYMGYMRQLNQKQKARVKRIKEMKGVRAAIRRAKDLAQR